MLNCTTGQSTREEPRAELDREKRQNLSKTDSNQCSSGRYFPAKGFFPDVALLS